MNVWWERAGRTHLHQMDGTEDCSPPPLTLPLRIAGQDRWEMGFMQLFVHLCAARNSLFTASARARLRDTVPMR